MKIFNRILQILTQDHLQNGLALYQQERYNDASAQFIKALKQFPDPASPSNRLANFYTTECYLALAETAEANGNTAEAITCYQKVLEYNEYPDVYYKLGLIYLHKNDLPTAESLFHKALKHSKHFRRAMVQLVITQIHLRRVEALETLEALSADEHIADKEPVLDAIRLHKLAKFDEAVAAIGSLLHDKPKEWVLMLKRGDDHFMNQEYPQALKYYQSALKLKPQYPDYHNRKGKALFELKRYQEAIQAFSRATVLNQDYVEAWINMGMCHLALGEMQEARSLFNRVLDLDPENEEALAQLKELLGEKA